MKISLALAGIQRLYIETAPLIYYIETNNTYIKRMDAVVHHVENTSLRAYSAVITLTPPAAPAP